MHRTSNEMRLYLGLASGGEFTKLLEKCGMGEFYKGGFYRSALGKKYSTIVNGSIMWAETLTSAIAEYILANEKTLKLPQLALRINYSYNATRNMLRVIGAIDANGNLTGMGKVVGATTKEGIVWKSDIFDDRRFMLAAKPVDMISAAKLGRVWGCTPGEANLVLQRAGLQEGGSRHWWPIGFGKAVSRPYATCGKTTVWWREDTAEFFRDVLDNK